MKPTKQRYEIPAPPPTPIDTEPEMGAGWIVGLVLVASIIGLCLLLLGVGEASAHRLNPASVSYPLRVVHSTDHAVRSARSCQTRLDRDRAPSHSTRSYARVRSVPYRLWSHRLWRSREAKCASTIRWLNTLPPRAISYVFRRLGPDDEAIALDVAGDEGSGGVEWTTDPRSWVKPYCTRSTNGQFLGCFQMGDWARSKYGHARDALGQAWAAFAYRVDARGWCSGWKATADPCGGID